MPYLCCLPGLLCGTALAVTDIRSRRVPRPLVLWGWALQTLVFLLAECRSPGWRALLGCVAGALCGAGLQLLLALVRPGALGLGDVTACLPMGCMVGWFGPGAFLAWWLAMGAIGCCWVTAWGRFAPGARKVPYVPVIAMAAAVAILA